MELGLANPDSELSTQAYRVECVEALRKNCLTSQCVMPGGACMGGDEAGPVVEARAICEWERCTQHAATSSVYVVVYNDIP